MIVKDMRDIYGKPVVSGVVTKVIKVTRGKVTTYVALTNTAYSIEVAASEFEKFIGAKEMMSED